VEIRVSGPSPFIDKAYEETMSLLVEARNYVAYQEASDQRSLPPTLRLQVSYESMRVTSRLTQVMAWMLAQKAFYAGEMSQARAVGEEFALSGGHVCSDPSGPDNAELPTGLRSLLERSHRLYMRVGRLEEMVRQAVA
jgi:regulator of CtrA degradation